MSKTVDKKEAFREEVRETFAPHTKSAQWFDHPDAERNEQPDNLKVANIDPHEDRHNDGAAIYRAFHLEQFHKYLKKASDQDHPVATHPSALPHFVTHIKKWEKWELTADEPDFEDLPRLREEVFRWYRGEDKPPGKERQEAMEERTKRLRPGGTGLILHGEQGTTKTTAMYWLVAQIMQINQEENVIWQSTLDDTEWQVFAPWATVCLPSSVDVSVTANPHSREYRDLGPVSLEMADVARQVIRYDNPLDLLSTLSNRRPGQVYVVYPDPHFRDCQPLTTYSYESIWEVDSTTEATNLNHFWFGLMRGLAESDDYNEWTTVVADEAHKWLRDGKGNDEHDWWNKVEQWATYWGDARKQRLSCLLAIHKWAELSDRVRKKVRWGGTMNGENFPPDAPIDGQNRYDQSLGDTCIWNNQEWNHVGYPDIKRHFSLAADISVTYPGFEAEKRAKS